MPDEPEALNPVAESPAAIQTGHDRDSVLAAIERDVIEEDAGVATPDQDAALSVEPSEAVEQSREVIVPAAKTHEETVPYDRFHQVNERANTLAPLEPWKAAVDALQQHGYQNPDQLVQALESQRQATQQQALADQIKSEYDAKTYEFGQEAADAWKEAKIESLQAQALVRQAQGQQYLNVVNQQWDSIKDNLPASVHAVAKDMLMQSSPQYLQTVVNTLKQIATDAKTAAIADYATAKGRDASGPVPVGKGGQTASQDTPAPKSGGNDWKRQSFTQLIGSALTRSA